MALPPLRQVITADTGQFDTALGNATSRLRRFAGPAGIGVAITALTALTRSSMQSIDEITKMARPLGIATDRFQAMAMVAEEAGVSQNSLANSIGRMQRVLVDATDGSASATRAIERLGLSINQIRRLSPDEQFRQLAESISAIQDPTERAAAAQEIFGRGGRDVINMLDDYGNALDEATEFQRRFGIAVSDEQAAAIERANDSIGRLGMAFRGLGNQLAVAATPAIEGFTRLIIGSAGAIADVYLPSLSDMQKSTQAAKQAQDALNEALGVFRDTAAPEAGRSAIELANDNVQLAESAMDAARAEIAKAQAIRASIAAETSGGRSGTRRTERRDAIEAETQATEALAQAERTLAEAIAARDEVARRITGSMFTAPDGEDEDGEAEDLIVPGVAGAGRVTDMLADRLEALVDGLQTEEETIADWYESGLRVLAQARERGLLTEEEYMAQRERLEEEHQARLAALRDQGNDNAFRSVVQSGQQILRAVGQNNERIAAAAQALGQFEATVNAFRAAAQVLGDPTVPWWQKLSAAATALATGIGFANSIRNMSPSSGSRTVAAASRAPVASAGAAQSTSATAAQAQASPPTQVLRFDFGGQNTMGMEQIVDLLNEAHDKGYRIRAVMA